MLLLLLTARARRGESRVCRGEEDMGVGRASEPSSAGERARAGETPVSLSLPAFGNRAAAFYSTYRILLDPCFTSSLRGWEDIHTTSRMDW